MREHYGNQGHCLHATRVALEVCHHYGIEAKPAFGAFIAFNAKGYRCFMNKTHPLPPAAWSVGVDREEPSGNNVGGHAYVQAKQDNEAWLIDLSAEMTDRPERGMPVPNVALKYSDTLDVFQWRGRGLACVWRVGKTTLLYTDGVEHWTPPWDWPTIPIGWKYKRNEPEIRKLITHIDEVNDGIHV